jgi:GUN4-like
MNFFKEHTNTIITGFIAPTIVGIILALCQPIILESVGVAKPDDRKAVIDCTRQLNNKGYTELESLCSPIKNGFLRKADHHTYMAIGSKLHGINWESKKSTRYTAKDIANGRICPQLKEIDKLWKESSNGKLGFSIQNKIWNKSKKNYAIFVKEVGWVDSETGWKKDFSYELASIPNGHLPALWTQNPGDPLAGKGSSKEEYKDFFETIESCKLEE